MTYNETYIICTFDRSLSSLLCMSRRVRFPCTLLFIIQPNFGLQIIIHPCYPLDQKSSNFRADSFFCTTEPNFPIISNKKPNKLLSFSPVLSLKNRYTVVNHSPILSFFLFVNTTYHVLSNNIFFSYPQLTTQHRQHAHHPTRPLAGRCAHPDLLSNVSLLLDSTTLSNFLELHSENDLC